MAYQFTSESGSFQLTRTYDKVLEICQVLMIPMILKMESLIFYWLQILGNQKITKLLEKSCDKIISNHYYLYTEFLFRMSLHNEFPYPSPSSLLYSYPSLSEGHPNWCMQIVRNTWQWRRYISYYTKSIENIFTLFTFRLNFAFYYLHFLWLYIAFNVFHTWCARGMNIKYF